MSEVAHDLVPGIARSTDPKYVEMVAPMLDLFRGKWGYVDYTTLTSPQQAATFPLLDVALELPVADVVNLITALATGEYSQETMGQVLVSTGSGLGSSVTAYMTKRPSMVENSQRTVLQEFVLVLIALWATSGHFNKLAELRGSWDSLKENIGTQGRDWLDEIVATLASTPGSRNDQPAQSGSQTCIQQLELNPLGRPSQARISGLQSKAVVDKECLNISNRRAVQLIPHSDGSTGVALRVNRSTFDLLISTEPTSNIKWLTENETSHILKSAQLLL
ncbi:hypothetical protein H4R33_002039 [Dimargaris cristalligena]|nr:hypothetical protein H4R33_002039 [Dimargaris cristalligena]